MSEAAAPSVNASLQLLEIELPPAPGTILRVLARDGDEVFPGPEGFKLGEGYTVSAGGELWRAILETVTRHDDVGGTEMVLRVERRSATGAVP
jgi:hypothetical protein